MATDRLTVYNIALRAVGERRLASLTEEREPRRLLDEVWNAGEGAVKYFLEEGLWNHAMRTVQIDKSASITTAFGFANAFDVPSDFVRLAAISAGPDFNDPLTQYEIETGVIYAHADPIYLRLVSDSNDFGNDLSRWPGTFTLWAGYWLGTQIAPDLKNDLDMEKLEKRTRRYLNDARSKDAQQEPPRWAPLSSWARARLGGRTSRRDRGSRSSLIG